jgi:outer membrane protein assembly factor BamB
MTQISELTPRKPLRLWPGVVVAVLVVLLRFVIPLAMPETFVIGLGAAILGGMLIVVWWLFFSRAAWSERVGAIALMIVAVFATRPLLHKSIATGLMGMMFFVYAVPPVLGPAFVAWAAATRHLSDGIRRATMVAAVLLACAVWTLVRTDGVMGESGPQLAWRWTKTAEERLLALGDDAPVKPAPAPVAPPELPRQQPVPAPKGGDEPAVPPAPAPSKPTIAPSVAAETGTPVEPTRVATPVAPVVRKTAEWPGFRGAERDGIVRGVRIQTDWSATPPLRMWHRPIGPGWSSFAIRGDLLYTQEQRGEEEIVSCYRVGTGEPVWRHSDGVRFWESNGGAGPRATPTLENDRLYTFGATGILNALDAASGAVVWSRNVASDSATEVPMWGFASSPLIVDSVVVVAASGKLVGYGLADGNLRWTRPTHGGSYSSPHRATIEGVPQILLLSAAGVTSVAPASGAVLWESRWPGDVTIVQPAVISDGDFLVTTAVSTGGVGTRRIAVAHRPDGWNVQERWTSNGLKPYFNDFVIHKGHAFGFDGSILACIDLQDGKRKWKGGRYGNGQLVLLPEQDLLLVVSEEGELALVKATPDGFTEVARSPAIEGKTWNHPALVGNVLLVRNGEEMAAFRLSLEGR